MSGKTLAHKILEGHLVDGKMEPGEEIGIKIDQTLTQDATGTMAYLEFEAMGIPRVRTELSVSYVDHNTLQTDFRNADDHKYLQSIAAKYGIIFSRPGNGICHQLHLERFGIPGKTLLGSDSHTPTGGGIGMIAIGAGGLDVAAAMAGEPFYLKMPEIVNVRLTGKLPPFVSAKDVILEVLRRIGVKGAVNKILEYTGPGVKSLSVPERATITNMGTETGATTSIFPSDKITREFMKAQGREKDWKPLAPDPDAEYDDVIEINLSELEPLIALPHSPGNVKKVSEVEGIKVDQVAIGSCTNSSLRDLMVAAHLLDGRRVHNDVSLVISPGSRQVVLHLVKDGLFANFIKAGARILENACGPCIGMGQAPPTNGVSVRTFNRNFLGRSGTKSAQVYLSSVETAVACAVFGEITDPRKLGNYPQIKLPERFIIDDGMFIYPPEDGSHVEIIRGPNIKPLPDFEPLPEVITGKVLIKVGDNITTDHILPGGAKILPLRSNIPEISKYTFSVIDPEFYSRAKAEGGGIIVGGENYGQGSSREHAAIAPRYLGIRAVLVKSFARIHRANLINFGILPLLFDNPDDYEKIEQGDVLSIATKDVDSGKLVVKNETKNCTINVHHDLSERELSMVKAGGKLTYIKEKNKR